jgi:methionyl-tRNA formyltransferase
MVAEQARLAGVPLLETVKMNSPEIQAVIAAQKPDLLVVSAFRGFLGPELLAMGQVAPVNIHPSLLPRHRGPAPVNWTMLEGDPKAGVSIISLTPEMDAGPVLAQVSKDLTPGQGAGELEAILAQEGAKLLLEVIEGLKNKTIEPKVQDPHLVTIGRRLVKADGRLVLNKPAWELANQINGLDPWPGAMVLFRNKPLKLFGAIPRAGEGTPGQILGLEDGRLILGTGDGVLVVPQCQPEGRNRMSGSDFFHGYRPKVLTSCPAD